MKHSVVSDVGKKNLIFKGYRPCNYCGIEENWRRIFWEPISKKKNKSKKKEYGVDYRVSKNEFKKKKKWMLPFKWWRSDGVK